MSGMIVVVTAAPMAEVATGKMMPEAIAALAMVEIAPAEIMKMMPVQRVAERPAGRAMRARSAGYGSEVGRGHTEQPRRGEGQQRFRNHGPRGDGQGHRALSAFASANSTAFRGKQRR